MLGKKEGSPTPLPHPDGIAGTQPPGPLTLAGSSPNRFCSYSCEEQVLSQPRGATRVRVQKDKAFLYIPVFDHVCSRDDEVC